MKVPAMSFRASEQTLVRLEWPELVLRLRAHLRTPRAQAALDSLGIALFAPDLSSAREQLAETREAKAILDAGDVTPAAEAISKRSNMDSRRCNLR